MNRSYLNCYTLGRSVPSMERLDFLLPCGREQALSLLALHLNIKQILVAQRRLLPLKIPDTTLYVSRVSNNDMATFLWRTGYLKLSSNPLIRQMERWLYEYQLFRHVRRQEQTVDEVVVELFHAAEGKHPLLALEEMDNPKHDLLMARLQFTEPSTEQTLLRIFIGWAELAPLAELDTLYNLLRGYIHLMTKVLLPDAGDGAPAEKLDLTAETVVTAKATAAAQAAMAHSTTVETTERGQLFVKSAHSDPMEPASVLQDHSFAGSAPDPVRLDLPDENKSTAGREKTEELGSERPFPEDDEPHPRPTAADGASNQQQKGWLTGESSEVDWLHSGNGFFKKDVPVEPALTNELDKTAGEGNQEPGQRPLPRLPQSEPMPADDDETLYRYMDPPRFYGKTLAKVCRMVAERQRQIAKRGWVQDINEISKWIKRPSRNTLCKIPELVTHWDDVEYCWNVETWLRRYSGHNEKEISELLSYLRNNLKEDVWAAVTQAGKEEVKNNKNRRHRQAQDERDSREKGTDLR